MSYSAIFFPLKVSGEELIERYTSTRNWSTAPVKCLAWHPHIAKIAVATEDDSIQVFHLKIKGLGIFDPKTF